MINLFDAQSLVLKDLLRLASHFFRQLRQGSREREFEPKDCKLNLAKGINCHAPASHEGQYKSMPFALKCPKLDLFGRNLIIGQGNIDSPSTLNPFRYVINGKGYYEHHQAGD